MLTTEIQQAIEASVRDVVESGGHRAYLSEHSERLISQLQAKLESEYWLLCSSGTAALEILLRAMQIEAGDEVLLCAYDYPGNFWAIERTGARPVLVDTRSDSWDLAVGGLEEAVPRRASLQGADRFAFALGASRRSAAPRVLRSSQLVLN